MPERRHMPTSENVMASLSFSPPSRWQIQRGITQAHERPELVGSPHRTRHLMLSTLDLLASDITLQGDDMSGPKGLNRPHDKAPAMIESP